MNTIKTRYFGPSNTKGARIITTTGSGDGPGKPRMTLSRAGWKSLDACHKYSAKAMAKKLGWRGKWIGGHTKDGMVWVMKDDYYNFVVRSEGREE